jgi:hypothetical protein
MRDSAGRPQRAKPRTPTPPPPLFQALEKCPQKRPSVKQLLVHPWFDKPKEAAAGATKRRSRSSSSVTSSSGGGN